MSRPQEHDYISLTETSSSMERSSGAKISSTESLNLKETELRLGLPGSEGLEKKHVSGSKRGLSDANVGGSSGSGKWVFAASEVDFGKKGQSSKAQVVGWPPIRSFRKNTMATNSTKNGDDSETKTRPECLYVKVSMDGAPYLRKIDLNICSNYMELSSALENMFGCFTIEKCSPQGLPKSRLMDLVHGSEYVLTYEDKDHDLMPVGDVPWEMFIESCKRLKIMKVQRQSDSLRRPWRSATSKTSDPLQIDSESEGLGSKLVP